jgi:hypothetical protein
MLSETDSTDATAWMLKLAQSIKLTAVIRPLIYIYYVMFKPELVECACLFVIDATCKFC